MPKWLGTLLIIGFVLCMPLWMPVALVLQSLDKRRLRKAANTFACVTCGRILGREALTLADKVCAEQTAELMRQNPMVKYLMVRTLHAICPNCGTRYTFRDHERTFVVRAQ